MDKNSFYNIYVNFKDSMLLYNTLSNSLICLTKEEFDVIHHYMADLQVFDSEYPILYEELKKAGFIVNESLNEQEYIKLQNKRCIFVNKDFHITINPTLECNLKCWYCSVKYAEGKFNNEGMNSDIVNSIITHIKKVIQLQNPTSFHLDWFGGEPLMYFSSVIDPISSNANTLVQQNNVKFTQHITTNATLLDDERIWRMKELNFTSFQIPIDGNEQRHNKIKFINKQGTYRKVIDNINKIAEIIPNVHIVLRINYDRQTLKKIQDIIKDIDEKNKHCIRVDFQKVWQVSCTEKDINLLRDVKEQFRLNGLISDYWAFNPRKFHKCYSDKYHHYAINYDGKIYKCTARDYGDDKVIGLLLPGGNVAWNDELLGQYFSKSTFENERCLACKKLPLCMGPCIQKNHDSLVNDTPLPCDYDYVQYALESFIIEEATKRNLI